MYMDGNELKKRAYDLAERCERNSCVTNTGFLTPAEQYELCSMKAVFFGGNVDCERKIAFFLPFYIDESDFDVFEYIDVLKIQSYFGVPSHRDYMGAILGLGIKREWVGDIIVSGDCAYVFCMKSVSSSILEMERAGRTTVKVSMIDASQLPLRDRKTKLLTFTVKSLRLDAVTGDVFGISRTTAAAAIKEGLVSLNYNVCLKSDAQVNEGDIISLKGKGKGIISEIGGKSRKDRLFVSAELFI